MSFTGFLFGFYIHGSEHQVLSDVSTLLQGTRASRSPSEVVGSFTKSNLRMMPGQSQRVATVTTDSTKPPQTDDLKTRRYQCLTCSTALHANTTAGFCLCGHKSAVILMFISLTDCPDSELVWVQCFIKTCCYSRFIRSQSHVMGSVSLVLVTHIKPKRKVIKSPKLEERILWQWWIIMNEFVSPIKYQLRYLTVVSSQMSDKQNNQSHC